MIKGSIGLLAAVEGLLFGISAFFFVLDMNGGPEGLRSRELYIKAAEEYIESGNDGSLDGLYKEYGDYVGFLTVDGTSIAYPVMRDRFDSDGNYYYLTHNYLGDEDRSGCPFIPRSSDLSDDLVMVYAHNNSNGTMFADLSMFEDDSFMNAHHEVIFDTVYGRREYEVIAVLDVSVDSGAFTYFGWSNFIDVESETGFIDQIDSLANVRRDYGLHPGNQYLLLVTCEYSHSNGRRIVVAVNGSEPDEIAAMASG